MFGIGMQELLIILVVALIFIGPSKLPEVARSIAKGLREVRKASDDLRSTIMLDDDPPPLRTPARTLPPPKSNSAPVDAEVSPPIQGSVAVLAEGALSRGSTVQGGALPTETKPDPNDADDHGDMPKATDDAAVRALVDDAQRQFQQKVANNQARAAGETKVGQSESEEPLNEEPSTPRA